MSEWLMEGIPRNIADDPDMKTVERIRASIIDDNGQTLDSDMLMSCPSAGMEADPNALHCIVMDGIMAPYGFCSLGERRGA